MIYRKDRKAQIDKLHKKPKTVFLRISHVKNTGFFCLLDYLYALSLLMLFNTSVVKSIIAVNIKIYTGNNPMLIYWAISPNNGGINVVPT